MGDQKLTREKKCRQIFLLCVTPLQLLAALTGTERVSF